MLRYALVLVLLLPLLALAASEGDGQAAEAPPASCNVHRSRVLSGVANGASYTSEVAFRRPGNDKVHAAEDHAAQITLPPGVHHGDDDSPSAQTEHGADSYRLARSGLSASAVENFDLHWEDVHDETVSGNRTMTVEKGVGRVLTGHFVVTVKVGNSDTPLANIPDGTDALGRIFLPVRFALHG